MLKQKFHNRKAFCLEVNPPRGTSISVILDRLASFKEAAISPDFFNVTDSALASMKLSPIAMSAILKAAFPHIEPLFNFTCRDKNLIALQSDLLGGWALGLKSLIALTGDKMSVGDLPYGKSVFEVNSVGLLGLVKKLNSGYTYTDRKMNAPTDYICGVVVNPNANNIDSEIKRLKRKEDSGGYYALSQPIFDIERAWEFFSKAREATDIKLMLGLFPMKKISSLEHVASIPGIKVAPCFMDRAKSCTSDTDLEALSLEHCLESAQKLHDCVDGFHVISGASLKMGIDLVKLLIKEHSTPGLARSEESKANLA